MFPAFTCADSMQVFLEDAKLSCHTRVKTFGFIFPFAQPSDLKNFISCQPCPIVFLPTQEFYGCMRFLPALPDRILPVIHVCSWEQMNWPKTGWIIAVMAGQFLWVWLEKPFKGKFKRQPMNPHLSISASLRSSLVNWYVDAAISGNILIRRPFNAWITTPMLQRIITQGRKYFVEVCKIARITLTHLSALQWLCGARPLCCFNSMGPFLFYPKVVMT